jgi:hypothetical protein
MQKLNHDDDDDYESGCGGGNGGDAYAHTVVRPKLICTAWRYGHAAVLDGKNNPFRVSDIRLNGRPTAMFLQIARRVGDRDIIFRKPSILRGRLERIGVTHEHMRCEGTKGWMDDSLDSIRRIEGRKNEEQWKTRGVGLHVQYMSTRR